MERLGNGSSRATGYWGVSNNGTVSGVRRSVARYSPEAVMKCQTLGMAVLPVKQPGGPTVPLPLTAVQFLLNPGGAPRRTTGLGGQ